MFSRIVFALSLFLAFMVNIVVIIVCFFIFDELFESNLYDLSLFAPEYVSSIS